MCLASNEFSWLVSTLDCSKWALNLLLPVLRFVAAFGRNCGGEAGRAGEKSIGLKTKLMWTEDWLQWKSSIVVWAAMRSEPTDLYWYEYFILWAVCLEPCLYVKGLELCKRVKNYYTRVLTNWPFNKCAFNFSKKTTAWIQVWHKYKQKLKLLRVFINQCS